MESTRSCSANLRIGRMIGRARARPIMRPIRKFALHDRVDSMVVGKVLGGKPAQGFVHLLP